MSIKLGGHGLRQHRHETDRVIDLYSRENEKVIVNLKTERKDRLVQTLPAVMSKGTIFLTAVNNTDIEWKIDRYQMMGSLDCRSLGYFHISRHSLQRIM